MADDDAQGNENKPPTREELQERIEQLKRRTDKLIERAEAKGRPSLAAYAVRVLLLFGPPILVAIGVYVFTASILFAILALVAALIATFAIALRVVPAPVELAFGTRANEAYRTAILLDKVIDERREEQRTTSDPERRARLEREIAFLSKQLDWNLAIVIADDRSPGKGYVGYVPYVET
jgi:hypothetical protein